MKDKAKNKKRDAENYRDKREQAEEKVETDEKIRRDEIASQAASKPEVNLGAMIDLAMTHAVRQYAQKKRERARNKARRASRNKNHG